MMRGRCTHTRRLLPRLPRLAASMALVGSLRRPVEAAGGGVSGVPARMAALRHRRAGDGALGAPPPAKRRCRHTTASCCSGESFLGNFLFSVCMLYGVALSSALAAGVIMAALPAVVALLSWLFLRERIGRRESGPASPARWPASRWCRCRRAEGDAGSTGGQPAAGRRRGLRGELCRHRQAADGQVSGPAASARSSICGAWCW